MKYKWQELADVNTVSELNKIIKEGLSTDLINVTEARMEKQFSDIADEISKRQGVRVILIAGPSSSGKTTTCKKLSIHLVVNGIWPVGISLDDYFVNREDTPLDDKGEYDFESLYALNLPLFNEQLTKLINGKTVELPRYNFMTGKSEKSGEKLKLSRNEVLVIEGIHALNPELTADIPEENIFRLYAAPLTAITLDDDNVITNKEYRLLRRIIRDAKYRNSDALKTMQRWTSVRNGEKKWILPFRNNADMTVDTAMLYELAVIKHQAVPLLKAVTEDAPEYAYAQTLLRFLDYFEEIPENQIPPTSLLREFVGGSTFEY